MALQCWHIATFLTIFNGVFSINLRYTVEVDRLGRAYTDTKCTNRRPIPHQNLLAGEITFDKACNRYNQYQGSQCTREDLFCHQDVILKLASNHGDFSLSIIGNMDCGDSNSYSRLLSMGTLTVDSTCKGSNADEFWINIQGRVWEIPRDRWHLLIMKQGDSIVVSINDVHDNGIQIPWKFPSSLVTLTFGMSKNKALNDTRTYLGSIKVADLFLGTLTHNERLQEIQYGHHLLNDDPLPWCLCPLGPSSGRVQNMFSSTCPDGSNRLVDHNNALYDTTESLYDGAHPHLVYDYWLAMPDDILIMDLEHPSQVFGVEIYAEPVSLSVMKKTACGLFTILFTIQSTESGNHATGTSIGWNRVPNEDFYQSKWQASTQLILQSIKVQFHHQTTSRKVYEVVLQGRPIELLQVECNCILQTSKSCNTCGQCICKGGKDRMAGRNCLPYISSMEPTYGPAQGETLITLRGGLLNPAPHSQCPQTNITIAGHQLCTNIQRNDTTILCTTTSMMQDLTLGRPAPVTVAVLLGDVHYQVQADLQFEYRPTPVIVSIKPNFAFRSSGHRITILGRNLDSIDYKSQEGALVLKQGTFIINISCEGASRSQVLCEVPSLPEGVQVATVYFAAYPNSSQQNIRVCPTPQIREAIVPLTRQDTLQIKGRYLDSCGSKATDYQITFGGVQWPVTSFTSTRIFCNQPYRRNISLEKSENPIKVYLHNHTYLPEFMVNPGNKNVTNVPLVAGSLTATFGLLLLMLGIYRFFRRRSSRTEDIPPAPTLEEITMTERREPTALDMLEGDLHHVVVERLIDKARLEILELVGRGNFGKVYRGILDGNVNRTEVAMKTLSDSENIGTEALGQFLHEATIMRDFQHPNVLSLLGVMVDGLKCYVIMPFMSNGDLRSFVIEKEFDMTAYTTFILDVAKGMEYLSKQKFVHRDLAARNCLVDVNEKVVVGDFGLARDIYHKDYYKAKDKKALPYKWMALEVLEDLAFSIFSDVWAFGVLMWEVFKKGGRPYALIPNQELKAYLQKGNRLDKPPVCAMELYTLMEDCWKANPGKRPTFSTIVKTLEEFLNSFQYSSSDDSSDLTSLSSIGSIPPPTAIQMNMGLKTESEYLLPTKPMPPVPLPRLTKSLAR